uniref:Uncharacterized protein n=1 Tax=Arundo donax TaxID=35708 RepID=A0A0A8YB20_ARUDO
MQHQTINNGPLWSCRAGLHISALGHQLWKRRGLLPKLSVQLKDQHRQRLCSHCLLVVARHSVYRRVLAPEAEFDVKSYPSNLLTQVCCGMVERRWSSRNLRLKWSMRMRKGRVHR